MDQPEEKPRYRPLLGGFSVCGGFHLDYRPPDNYWLENSPARLPAPMMLPQSFFRLWRHHVVRSDGIECIQHPKGNTSKKERCHEVAGLIVLRSFGEKTHPNVFTHYSDVWCSDPGFGCTTASLP